MSAPRRDELPLADYDHLPVPALRDRIRSLTTEELEQLLAGIDRARQAIDALSA